MFSIFHHTLFPTACVFLGRNPLSPSLPAASFCFSHRFTHPTERERSDWGNNSKNNNARCSFPLLCSVYTFGALTLPCSLIVAARGERGWSCDSPFHLTPALGHAPAAAYSRVHCQRCEKRARRRCRLSTQWPGEQIDWQFTREEGFELDARFSIYSCAECSNIRCLDIAKWEGKNKVWGGRSTVIWLLSADVLKCRWILFAWQSLIWFHFIIL